MLAAHSPWIPQTLSHPSWGDDEGWWEQEGLQERRDRGRKMSRTDFARATRRITEGEIQGEMRAAWRQVSHS